MIKKAFYILTAVVAMCFTSCEKYDHAIADIMKANPEMRVRITGWGDEIGGEEVNKRVSLQRAEAVKRMLGKWLIPAERVEAVGAGIAHDAQSREEARHAATIEITENR